MVPTAEERIEEHGEARYAKVVEHIEGHYECEKVPFGRIYRWRTGCVVAECACGERVALSSSMTTCAGCGTDHAAVVQERLPTERAAAQADEALRPWRLARDRDEGDSLPC
jgi:hypothetical protein